MKLILAGHYDSYTFAMRPWRIRYKWSKKSLGRGAFNLIRKEAYQKIGGHQAIAMECLDDLKLGELVKKSGFHCNPENDMVHNRKKRDSDDPKPLNFDHDKNKGPGDHLKKPFMTGSDQRGDNKDDQYYDSEEALSPEEVKKRKEEGNL